MPIPWSPRLRWTWAWVLLAGFGLSACLDEAVPSTWVLHESTQRVLEEQAEDPEAAQAAVEAALESLFGQAHAPHWPMAQSDSPAGRLLVETAEIYRDECSHCHGLEGYGDGPSSPFLNPKPWNFSLGVFPRSAPQGGEPSLEALTRLLREGIPSSSMPKFERLGEERLKALGGHVFLLLRRSKLEPILVQAYLAGGAPAIAPEAAFELYQNWSDEQNAARGPADATPTNPNAQNPPSEAGGE